MAASKVLRPLVGNLKANAYGKQHLSITKCLEYKQLPIRILVKLGH